MRVSTLSACGKSSEATEKKKLTQASSLWDATRMRMKLEGNFIVTETVCYCKISSAKEASSSLKPKRAESEKRKKNQLGSKNIFYIVLKAAAKSCSSALSSFNVLPAERVENKSVFLSCIGP